jgi:leukotriene-A4 hydrolase
MQALRSAIHRRISHLAIRQSSQLTLRHLTTSAKLTSWSCVRRQKTLIDIRKMSTTSWTPPTPGSIPAPPLAPPKDIHSHANLIEIKPTHIDIDWVVDWEKRLIFGKVTHTIQVTEEGVDQFILDTSHLDIKNVTSDSQELKWSLGKRKGTLGSPLTIQLGSRKKGEEVKVEIKYSTTDECTALGWLTTE